MDSWYGIESERINKRVVEAANDSALIRVTWADYAVIPMADNLKDFSDHQDFAPSAYFHWLVVPGTERSYAVGVNVQGTHYRCSCLAGRFGSPCTHGVLALMWLGLIPDARSHEFRRLTALEVGQVTKRRVAIA